MTREFNPKNWVLSDSRHGFQLLCSLLCILLEIHWSDHIARTESGSGGAAPGTRAQAWGPADVPSPAGQHDGVYMQTAPGRTGIVCRAALKGCGQSYDCEVGVAGATWMLKVAHGVLRWVAWGSRAGDRGQAQIYETRRCKCEYQRCIPILCGCGPSRQLLPPGQAIHARFTRV